MDDTKLPRGFQRAIFKWRYKNMLSQHAVNTSLLAIAFQILFVKSTIFERIEKYLKSNKKFEIDLNSLNLFLQFVNVLRLTVVTKHMYLAKKRDGNFRLKVELEEHFFEVFEFEETSRDRFYDIIDNEFNNEEGYIDIFAADEDDSMLDDPNVLVQTAMKLYQVVCYCSELNGIHDWIDPVDELMEYAATKVPVFSNEQITKFLHNARTTLADNKQGCPIDSETLEIVENFFKETATVNEWLKYDFLSNEYPYHENDDKEEGIEEEFPQKKGRRSSRFTKKNLRPRNSISSCENKKGFQITNVVSSIDLKINVDLLKVMTYCSSTSYNPLHFKGLTVRLDPLNAIVIVYSNGKLISCGASSVKRSTQAVCNVGKIIQNAGYRIEKSPQVIVESIWATYYVGLKINVPKFAKDVNCNYSFFSSNCSLYYYMLDPKVTVKVGQNGCLTFMGCKSVDSLRVANKKMLALLQRTNAIVMKDQ